MFSHAVSEYLYPSVESGHLDHWSYYILKGQCMNCWHHYFFFIGTNTVLYTMVCRFRHVLSVSAASRKNFHWQIYINIYIYAILSTIIFIYIISHYIHCISIFLFSVNTLIISPWFIAWWTPRGWNTGIFRHIVAMNLSDWMRNVDVSALKKKKLPVVPHKAVAEVSE